MNKTTMLSSVALVAMALAIAPASAQSIDVLGGSDNGGASVSLGGGSSGGSSGTGANINLGTGTNSSTANVGVGNATGGRNIIDVNGDGILDLDDGDVIDLNGNGIVDGDEAAGVRLFGPADDGETQVAVGAGDANDDDVLVTLFGAPGAGDADGSDVARANILPNGTSAGEGDDVKVELLGGGEGSSDVAGAGGSDVALDLFGPGSDDGNGNGGEGTDPTQTGSVDDGDDDGTGASGGGATVPNGTRVASSAGGSARSSGSCFSPDQTQIDHLLARGSYDANVAAQWQSADTVAVVPVNLCADARDRLEAAVSGDAEINQLQAAVASDAMISSEINPQYQADDVLAVDQSGEDLTVYVY